MTDSTCGLRNTFATCPQPRMYVETTVHCAFSNRATYDVCLFKKTSMISPSSSSTRACLEGRMSTCQYAKTRNREIKIKGGAESVYGVWGERFTTGINHPGDTPAQLAAANAKASIFPLPTRLQPGQPDIQWPVFIPSESKSDAVPEFWAAKASLRSTTVVWFSNASMGVRDK